MTYEQMQAFTYEELQNFTYEELQNWQFTTKTDWKATYTDGVYTGDYFDYEQYNRVKSNINYLKNFALVLYLSFAISSVGDDKTPDDTAIFADEVNNLEDMLEAIKDNTYALDIGTKKTFYENTKYIDYIELNRIESACLKYYNLFKTQLANISNLPFTCGNKIGGMF